ncbi:hypothetical protein [Desulfitobacterium chlororespirans]|uniref:DUF4064 domain-containing protein n=1 Tax=Desulfitobacterium chlororespirans DSM 11544 TaxID=1121395 RepID=A0A1M7UZQ3_9FIRM|nr:hypothetical protein [Desulfitobacterium chlororespirans]SHN88434.1 hypothetical protein SAMN02745215_05332 [Desulfitobacterium chlororespirans DSM 11544]
MVKKLIKLLAVCAPFLSIYLGYQMWFGFKYTGGRADLPPETITALQFALEHSGAKAILFWPICLFVISTIGALCAWKENRMLVWIIVIFLMIVSVLGMWSIGLLVFHLAVLFLVIGILLTYSARKVPD